MSSKDDEVHVSSVVYNLAGPETGRTDFLGSLVLGAIQQDAPLTDSIIHGYQNGPAIRYRNFANWARNNSDFIEKFGVTSGTLDNQPTVDFEKIRAQIPTNGIWEVERVEVAEIDTGKLHYWVLKFMYENYPNPSIRVPWPPPFTGRNTYSYNETTNQIQYIDPDGTYEYFEPEGYDPDSKFLYVKFIPVIPKSFGDIEYEPEDVLDESDPDPEFPSPWLLKEETPGLFQTVLTTQVVVDSVFSDSRPPEQVIHPPVETPVEEPTSFVHYTKDEYLEPNEHGARRSKRYHAKYWTEWEVVESVEVTVEQVELEDDVIRTDTITTTTQSLKPVRRLQEGTQEIIWKSLLSPRWFIYKEGSGNAILDEVIEGPIEVDTGMFFPPIPFRYDNKAIAPLKKSAERWTINVGTLPFDWHRDMYDLIPKDRWDVQVSNRPGENATWVSVKWISKGEEPGTYVVEARPKDDNPDFDEDPENDKNDMDIEYYHPLYRVFQHSSSGSPGYFRVRAWDVIENRWEVAYTATRLLSAPIPDPHGYDPAMEELYKEARFAFKHATGSEFDDVLESLHETDSIEDIDYAYAVFGVSLNVKEDACKKYIYQFLLKMREYAESTFHDELLSYNEFKAQYMQAHDSAISWKNWWEHHHHPNGERKKIDEQDPNSAYMPDEWEEPERVPYPQFPRHRIHVHSVRKGISDYRTSITWSFIDEDEHEGVLIKPKEKEEDEDVPARPGELFFTVEEGPLPDVPNFKYESMGYTYDVGATSDFINFNSRVKLKWQVTDNTWKELTIIGMVHHNYIYKDHFVSHSAASAVKWTQKIHTVDEDGNPITEDTGIYEESPFIFPLHEDVYRDMRLVDATQMATACTFLVLNCYQIRKKKWYESTWFKVVLIVVAVAIVIASVAGAIYTGGATLGVGGAAVKGLIAGGAQAGIFAILVGFAVDVAIGLALSYLTTFLADLLFGEKVGSIVGPILGMILGGFVAGGFDLDSFIKIFSTSAGWINLGIAITNGTAQFLNTTAQEIIAETAELLKEKNLELAKLYEQYNEEFNNNRIDPTTVNQYIQEVLEKPDVFLQRTLMTGSDIVQATLDEIERFTETRLDLALP